MQKVKVDDTLRNALNGCRDDIEMVDESGKPVGHFVPEELYRKMLYAWVESQCPYSAEEIQWWSQETGGRSLKEIWKDLGVS